ncbi:MAG: hypothetical protein M1493_13150 [Firmicutes bacterium]|jgi:hypothetical protein|uniref:Uncharacterized protein n=1 Tax=Sulfobacillus benefaciens TaxID=453960 RepID=A0A2T2WWD2_9FIRM|nr:hypothetical protein [Bacillota bacterium]PSR26532.1 MAG: hypothetical protein C7B43_13735 [Sulfobacillus benefaciens]HBQ95419.1 hypothetical protein [Sulfobacillus sp.]
MVRTEYATWLTMSSASDDEIDMLRQKIEAGQENDVVLVFVSNQEIAESAVERLQDVGGEYIVSAHDNQRLLLLRSHAWSLCRNEAHNHVRALIDLLEEALEVALDADPEIARELADKSAQHLEGYPAVQKRFRYLGDGMERRNKDSDPTPSSHRL